MELFPGCKASGLGLPGVFLFFVLSSFLLTAQLLDRADSGQPIGWARFGARRLLRILPAYALALGVHVLFGVFSSTEALQHLVMTRAEGHFWTIPVEVLFYVTLPLLVVVLGRLQGPLPRFAALIVAAAALRWVFPPELAAKAPAYTPHVPPFLPVFLVGAILASTRSLWLDGKVQLSASRRHACLWLGSLAIAVILAFTPAIWSILSGAPTDYRRFHLWFDPFAGLWALVIVAALQRGGWIRAASSWAPLRWLGQISYSVYLFHALLLGFFVERGAELGLAPELLGPLFLVASIAVGAVSYFLVERPFLQVLRVPREPSHAAGEPGDS